MFNYNKVEIGGTLTKDPEVKFTPRGKAVCQVSLAVNRQWKNEAGEKQEEVTFLDVEAWGRTAEVIGDYCRKGHNIFIVGRLKLDVWDDKESGKKRSKIKIICDEMHFVSKPKGQQSEQEEERPRSQARPAAGRPASQQRPPVNPDPHAAEYEAESDIPF